MRFLLRSCFATLALMASVLVADAYQVQTVSAPFPANQCTGANNSVRYYLRANSYTRSATFYPGDSVQSTSYIQIQNDATSTISNDKTTIIETYVTPQITCGDLTRWITPSPVVPANKVSPAINSVWALQVDPLFGGCAITSRPATRDTPVFQAAYQIAYRNVTFNGPAGSFWDITIHPYNPTTGVITGPNNYRITPDYSVSPTVQRHARECRTYYAAWCGDGVVDSAEGEVCDAGAANGAAGSTCSATCTIVTTPPPRNFDLSIQKFVNTQDADTDATAIILRPDNLVRYNFIVTNNGPATATGTTTVEDTDFPSGVTLTSTPIGTGWSCTLITGGFRCTRSDILASGGRFPDIIVDARIATSTPNGTFLRNVACVINPGQIDHPQKIGSNNCDPGVIRVENPMPPVCVPGTTTGQQSTPITFSTPGLCPAGQGVGNFTPVNSGNRTTYTWSCNGSQVGGACTAFYDTPSPTCDLLTATPNSSNSGTLTSTLTCRGSNLPAGATYSIACGNGQTLNASTGICSYTTGSYTARCTINGSITSPSCTAGINVVNPPPAKFELALKKYVNTVSPATDAQTPATAVPVVRANSFSYVIRVNNIGPDTVTGTTTVTDTLPSPILLTSVTGAGWSCTPSGNSFTCTTTARPSGGQSFPDITVLALVPAGIADGTYRNDATVTNPFEKPTPTDNTDPAHVVVRSDTPSPTCDLLTATPNSSNSGTLTSTLTCRGSNLPAGATYSIACGNGQTLNASTGICSYTTGSYTARCTINGSITSPSCTAGINVNNKPPVTPFYDLGLIKTVNGEDANTPETAVLVNAGDTVTYGFRVYYATGNIASTGAITITDNDFPAGITLIGTPSGTGWVCIPAAARSFFCSRSDVSLSAGQSLPTLFVQARLDNFFPVNTYLKNIARVFNPGQIDDDVNGPNNTDPAHICVLGAPPQPKAYDLGLIKTVNGQDANTPATAVDVNTGATVTYGFRVYYASGNVASTGAITITDTSFPAGITLVGTPTGTGWVCNPTASNNFSCSRSDIALSTGQSLPTLFVRANIGANVASGTILPNIARVFNSGQIDDSVNGPNNTDPAHVRVLGNLPPGDAVCVPGPTTGAQTSPVTASTPGLCPSGTSVNNFTTVVSGTTASYTWSCGTSAVGGSCSASFTSGGGGGGGTPRCLDLRFGGYPTSATGVLVPTGAPLDVVCEGQLAISAVVDCGNGLVIPAISDPRYTGVVGGNAFTAQCRYTDANVTYRPSCSINTGITDPACTGVVVTSTGSTGCPGCGGGGGGGGGGGFPRCGNGIIESGEQCDPGLGGYASPTCTATCQLKTTITNPGSDGTIVPFILRSTGGGGSRVPKDGVPNPTGPSTFTNPGADEVNLYNYRALIGSGVSVFTSRDTIYFQTPSSVSNTNPLIVPRGTRVCLGPVDTTVTARDLMPITGADDICYSLSETYVFPATASVTGPIYSTTPSGDRYVSGFETCNASNTASRCQFVFANEIPLFGRATPYSITRWVGNGSAFSKWGNRVHPEGFVYTNYLYSTLNSVGIRSSAYKYLSFKTPSGSVGSLNDIPRFSVKIQYLEQPVGIRVIGGAVANNAGGNAYIGSNAGTDIQKAASKEDFLPIVAKNFTTSSTAKDDTNALSSLTNNQTGALISNVSLSNLVPESIGGTTPSPKTVASVDDLDMRITRLPSNNNVYVHRGDLTISNGLGDFNLKGIRTVIVRGGNLIINSNIVNDATSSWAFIIEGGDVLISGNVDRIAGAYVAIKKDLDGGEFISRISVPRQLLIDGSLYGQATKLITGRTYLYANNFSESVSVGTVINYSNRALLFPPPFLVNILSQYSFIRN